MPAAYSPSATFETLKSVSEFERTPSTTIRSQLISVGGEVYADFRQCYRGGKAIRKGVTVPLWHLGQFERAVRDTRAAEVMLGDEER